MKKILLIIAGLSLVGCGPEDSTPPQGTIKKLHETVIDGCKVGRWHVRAPGSIPNYTVTIADCGAVTETTETSGKTTIEETQILRKAKRDIELKRLEDLSRRVEALRAELSESK